MNKLNQNKKITIRNLSIFAIVVLSIGWIGHGLDVLMKNPSSESLGMLLWIVTPLGACILLRAFAGGGWKDFGIRLNFKDNLLGYSIAVLVFPVVTAIILIIGRISGFILFSGFSAGVLGVFLRIFALALLPGFFKNIFEEFAWRGYLTPKVHSLRLNDYAGHLIVGLIWALWHVPYYLFFLDRALLKSYTTLDLAIFIPLALLAIVSYALVYGEIRLLTDSLWPVLLMHAIEDALVNPLLVEGFVKVKPEAEFFFSPGVSVLVIILFAATGIFLHKLRHGK
ncbi:CPBP family intramembrane metalloprotease [candidate division WOR-3 bacterium]|nr:CPBP family intramembrane metalloprotease [candidate division WOR-3 bacterium]